MFIEIDYMNRFILLFLIGILSAHCSKTQTPGYDINHIVVELGTSNPVEDISPVSIEKLPRDSTLDIVNWNVSFLGDPEKTDHEYGSREEHLTGVAEKLLNIDADVYGLQEIVVDAYHGNALQDLVSKMNELTGKTLYQGVVSEFHSYSWNDDDPDFPSQCLAFIWNTSSVSINQDSALLQGIAGNNDFGYGRLPYLLDADVTIRGITQRYFFINIHLKAGKDFGFSRASSMKLLKKMLNVNFYSNNMILLGDFNVASEPGAIGEIKEWGMYNDDEKDGLVDYVHAAGNKTSGIEHLLISDELFDELAYISEYDRNVIVEGTRSELSDHYAYMTSLYVHEQASGAEPENNPIYDISEGFTMVQSDYQVIVDYVNKKDLNNHRYPENSEDYFGASAYYSNFDIEKDGSWDQNEFDTWEKAVQTAITQALLPEKYPEDEVSDVIYTIHFKTYDGNSTGSVSFEFVCTKSSPNPEFALHDPTNMILSAVSSSIDVFPNPSADGMFVVRRSGVTSETIRIRIHNLKGQMVYETSMKPFQEETFLHLSGLGQGTYLLQLIDGSFVKNKRLIIQ